MPLVVKKSDLKRQQILNSSLSLVLHKGFVGVGLQEILKNCGVPKGSFYHYFESKETFGCELLRYYISQYQQRLNQLWATDATAKHKLMHYFQLWIHDPEIDAGWADRCLIVKLAAEVSDLSEDMRIIMAQGTDILTQHISDLIRQGELEQSIRVNAAADAVAQVLYQMWLGAALLSKLHKNKSALEQALEASEFMLGDKVN